MSTTNEPYETPKGFHNRDHLFFRREADGSVTVQKWTETKPFEQVFSLTIPPNEWASIVASMSAEGENGETWRAALQRQEPVSDLVATDSSQTEATQSRPVPLQKEQK